MGKIGKILGTAAIIYGLAWILVSFTFLLVNLLGSYYTGWLPISNNFNSQGEGPIELSLLILALPGVSWIINKTLIEQSRGWYNEINKRSG